MSAAPPMARLEEVTKINPAVFGMPGDELVSFLPMAAVDEQKSEAVDSELRRFSEVSKGYTQFTRDDVLVAKITPCFENGKIALAKPTRTWGFGSTEFHVLRADPTVLDPRYLIHFMRQPRIRLEGERKMTGSAGQRRVPSHFLASLSIPLPPLEEQRRIAAILDKADELRAKRRAAIAKLDTLTQAVFLDMFGDPATNPKGWLDKSLGESVVSLRYGPRFYNQAYSAEGVRIVRITDLDENGQLDFSSMPRMAVGPSDEAMFLVRPGEILFARSGATVGKAALVNEGDPPCIAGAYFIVMRFWEDVNPAYAFEVIRSPSLRARIAEGSRQSAQQNFSGPGLRRLPMPVPPRSLQDTFSRRRRAVLDARTRQCSSLQQLETFFSALQQRAFRGEL